MHIALGGAAFRVHQPSGVVVDVAAYADSAACATVLEPAIVNRPANEGIEVLNRTEFSGDCEAGAGSEEHGRFETASVHR